MLKIGITGNIGSGKTTVSKIFEMLAVPVFFADEAARDVMVTDNILVDGIKAAFGAASYFADGSLNRKYIAGIVFNDESKLKVLNSLVHPATFRAFDNWVSLQKNKATYVLKEAALLFETDAWKGCDSTILVTAPLKVRVERVMKRSGLTREEIISRDAKQLSERKKAELATYMVTNDESQLVIPQVLQLHNLFSRTT